jgi:hypothetical protein
MTNDLHVPRPPFLYTIDQVAQIASLSMSSMVNRYVFYDTLTAGRPSADLLIAHNIAPLGDRPDWRISDGELTRWLKRKGFRPRYDSWR